MHEAGPFRVAAFDVLGSTNDEALDRIKAGDPGGLFVVADRQTGGRGRQGRSWVSPPGNLYATLALVDPCAPSVAPRLGFVAGVAMATALRRLCGGDERLAIKWPNDVLFDGAKLAGLLLEGTMLPTGRFGCVIGFGVNCLSHPEALPYPATDLREAGWDLEAKTVLVALATEMDAALSIWNEGSGFEAVRARWLSMAAGLGEPVRVAMHGRIVEGTMAGLDGTGRLRVATSSGEVAIDAGDVFPLAAHQCAG